MVRRIIARGFHCWQWLALIGTIALATRPFWGLPKFFYSDDGLFHLLRLFEFDQMLRQGVNFPRWFGDLAWGMGYPSFDFYPMLATYLGEVPHLLGLGFAAATQTTFVISIIIAATGAFALGGELFPGDSAPTAGLLTAVAYVFFPYFLIDVITRGALGETLAYAFLPWLFWAWRQALTRQTISTWMLAALFLALLLVAHSATLLMSIPFLMAFSAWQIIELPRSAWRQALLRSACVVLLAMGLGAFYWVPFVVQLPLVRMGHGMPIITDSLPGHLLAPSQLVQPSLLYEYGAWPFALSGIPVLLGLFATLVALLARQSHFRRVIIFFAIVGAIFAVWMITPTRDLWLTLPVVTMISYPWRLSLFVGLSLALIIGSLPATLVSRISERSRSIAISIVSLAIAIILIYSALGNFVPQLVGFPDDEISLAQIARFEEYSGFIGLNTWGEYLPVSFQVPTLSAYQAASQPASRATVNVSRFDPVRRELVVNSAAPISMTLRALYYPDWRATVDAQPTAVYPSSTLGLVTVDIPAGEHRVAVFQETTPAQQAGNVISMLSGVAWLVLLWFARHESEARWMVALSVALLALVALPTGIALSAAVPPIQSTQVDVSSELRLIGLRVTSAQLSGDTWQVVDVPSVLHLQVIWHVQQVLADKPFTWQLVDASGTVRASLTQLARFGSGVASTWLPNEIVDDLYDVPLDAIPSGVYTLSVAYDDGRPVAVARVQFARDVSTTIVPNPPHVLDVQIGDRIRLVGYGAPDVVHPGDRLPLDLFWQALANVGDDYTVFVQLHDAHGESVAHMDSIPGGGLVPTSLWIPSKLVRDRIYLNLPLDLRPGLYHLVVGMYRYPDLKRLPVVVDGARAPDDLALLGQVKVPSMAQCSPSKALNVSLGSAIQLCGYDFAFETNAVKLTLYWQARSKVSEDYTVFLHVTDQVGKIVAQQDRQPDDGRYPTGVWDAGESIIDSYSFAQLPSGRYQIVVGMYSPDSGERLPVFDPSGNELENREIKITQFDWSGH
jgi:hypothetical protein